MPRISFMMMLYADVDGANAFIQQLLRFEGSHVHVHVDKKTPGITQHLVRDPRVRVMPTSHDVKWGDYSQILAATELLRFAADTGRHDYYSFHTGQDLAVRPLSEFAAFLTVDAGFAYLDATRLPAEGWGAAGGLERVALRWPAVFRRKVGGNAPTRYARAIYGRLYKHGVVRGKQLPDEPTLYGGSDYFTVSGDCATAMLTYLDANPGFSTIFTHSLIGSEIFFNTLACAVGAQRPIRLDDNLRYIDWRSLDPKQPGSPKGLTSDDLGAIAASGKFFARKFSTASDPDVYARILADTVEPT